MQVYKMKYKFYLHMYIDTYYSKILENIINSQRN